MKTTSKPTLVDELGAYSQAYRCIDGIVLDAVVAAVEDWEARNHKAIRKSARRKAFQRALDVAANSIPKATRKRALKSAFNHCAAREVYDTKTVAFMEVYAAVYFKAYRAAYEETKAKFPAYKTGRYPDKA